MTDVWKFPSASGNPGEGGARPGILHKLGVTAGGSSDTSQQVVADKPSFDSTLAGKVTNAIIRGIERTDSYKESRKRNASETDRWNQAMPAVKERLIKEGHDPNAPGFSQKLLDEFQKLEDERERNDPSTFTNKAQKFIADKTGFDPSGRFVKQEDKGVDSVMQKILDNTKK